MECSKDKGGYSGPVIDLDALWDKLLVVFFDELEVVLESGEVCVVADSLEEGDVGD